MHSITKRVGARPDVADDEESSLLAKEDSLSKQPGTHPCGSHSHSHSAQGRLPRSWGGCLACALCHPATWCAVLLLPVVSYLAVFGVFWSEHTRSPSWALGQTEGSNDATVSADFRSSCSINATEDCVPFFFGLATAPAHAEDRLNDSWLDFAQIANEVGVRKVKAWANADIPEERLRFWTEPEVEIELAAQTGVGVLRLGLDWGRIVPTLPPLGTMGDSATLSVVDWVAVERYKQILESVRGRGMRVMLTLFHHSLPKWGLAMGGWTNADLVPLFTQFTKIVAEHFGGVVDYWVTFNEPTLFVMATHCWCSWPPAPGACAQGWEYSLCPTSRGLGGRAMGNIARAHNEAFVELKKRTGGSVGVAHSVSVQSPFSVLDLSSAVVWDSQFLFPFIDAIAPSLDFCGLNYYGQEFVSSAGLHMVQGEEYSEAGRAVYPDGLFKLLMAFHERYRSRHPKLRYIITENGIADSDDMIRRAYMVEHLVALHAARKQGVPVDGYLHWTISDNWEWADGYCPKFGLVDVDRAANLTRTPRPSYYLYKQIVSNQFVSSEQRDLAWDALQTRAASGKPRPVCRYPEPSGLMAQDSLDVPTARNISLKDWRFGKYQHATFFTMLMRGYDTLKAQYVGSNPVDTTLVH